MIDRLQSYPRLLRLALIGFGLWGIHDALASILWRNFMANLYPPEADSTSISADRKSIQQHCLPAVLSHDCVASLFQLYEQASWWAPLVAMGPDSLVRAVLLFDHHVCHDDHG